MQNICHYLTVIHILASAPALRLADRHIKFECAVDYAVDLMYAVDLILGATHSPSDLCHPPVW